MKKIVMDSTAVEQLLDKIKLDLTQAKGLPDKIDYSLNPSITLTEDQKVEVVFENEAMKKMDALIEECSDEIGWYGTVVREGEKRFIIKDIFLMPQTVTGATVTTDDAEYAAWNQSLDDDTFNSMRFYGHSHVNMGCFPSTTDSTHYSNMVQNLRDFYIFGIFNKRGAHWFNIYDVENNVLYEDKDILYRYYVGAFNTWAKEQIEKYVKKKTYTYANGVGGYSGKYTGNVYAGAAQKGKPSSHGSWYSGWNGNGDDYCE